MGRLYKPGTYLCDVSLEFLYLIDRAIQTNCSETCYISSKSWESHLFRNVKLVFIKMSSENLQYIEVNSFQRPIPEINQLKFPNSDLILPFYSG